MSSATGHGWEDREREFRAEWERMYPNTAWSDVSYGYHYGWEQANKERYQGREWRDAEADLEAGWPEWEQSSRDNPLAHQLQQGWHELKESVKLGWERARREIERGA